MALFRALVEEKRSTLRCDRRRCPLLFAWSGGCVRLTRLQSQSASCTTKLPFHRLCPIPIRDKRSTTGCVRKLRLEYSWSVLEDLFQATPTVQSQAFRARPPSDRRRLRGR